MVYCSKCGKENKEDSEFCIKCGVSLKGKTAVKSSIEQNIEDFADEMGQLGEKAGKKIEETMKNISDDKGYVGEKAGKKAKEVGKSIEKGMDDFGKRMDAKGKEIGSWYDRSFGCFGPLISSFVGLIFLFLAIITLGFFGQEFQFMSNLSDFLTRYILIIFVLMLLSSYTQYLTKKHHFWFRWISPIAGAIGFYFGFWFSLRIIEIINNSTKISFVDRLIPLGDWLLPFIAVVVLIVGYVCMVFATTTKKEIEKPTGKKEIKKPSKEKTQDDEGLGYKRLYRSGDKKILGGICGGLAEYFTIDPIIVRIIWVIGFFVTIGGIILAYLILWIIVPRNPNHTWK